jgi:hypothetical protein
VDPITLASSKISSGPLFPISDKKQEIEDLGLAEIPGYLLFDTTRFLTSLGRNGGMADFHDRLYIQFELQRRKLDVTS